MISAREAQRLTKTRWQAELKKIEKLVTKAIMSSNYQITYVGILCSTTIDYLRDLGYTVSIENNEVNISWEIEGE